MTLPRRCSPEQIFWGGHIGPNVPFGEISRQVPRDSPARSWKLTRSEQPRCIHHGHHYQPTRQTPHDRGYAHPQWATRGESSVTGSVLLRRMILGINYFNSVMSPKIRTDTSRRGNFCHSSSHKSNFVHTTTTSTTNTFYQIKQP